MKYTNWYKWNDRFTIEQAIDDARNKFDIDTISIRISGSWITEAMYNENKAVLKNRLVTCTDYNPITKDFGISTEHMD